MSYDVVMTSLLPNCGNLGSAILDFWISPKLEESPEIERKVIKHNIGTLIWAKNINVTESHRTQPDP